MGKSGFAGRFVAVLTAIALQLALVAGAAVSPGSIRGTVVSGDSWTPHAGVVMHAVDTASGASFRSEPAADDGSFLLAGLPAAQYQLAAEADGGLYPVEQPVEVTGASPRVLNVVLNKNAASDPSKVKPSQGTLTGKKKMSLMSNPATATLIVVGSAVALGLLWEAVDNPSGGTGSPSMP